MEIMIKELHRNADNGGVIQAHWEAVKTDGEYTASDYGSESFSPDPQGPNFIPFEQLTEADVIGWMQAQEGWVETLQFRLDSNIAHQKNPPQVPPDDLVLSGLPWEQSEEQS